MIRLIRSSFSCMTLNRGKIAKNENSMRPSTQMSASPTVQDRDTLVRRAIITAPIPMSGANSIMRRAMVVACCTICTSLVDLVMRDAVENRSSSAELKAVTFRKTSFLTPRAVLAAVSVAKRLPVMEQAAARMAMRIMMVPTLLMWSMSPLTMPLLMISDM